MNLIECFFSVLSKQGLAHSVQRSEQDLKDLLHQFLQSYNASCGPFTWTKGPEQLQHTLLAWVAKGGHGFGKPGLFSTSAIRWLWWMLWSGM